MDPKKRMDKLVILRNVTYSILSRMKFSVAATSHWHTGSRLGPKMLAKSKWRLRRRQRAAAQAESQGGVICITSR